MTDANKEVVIDYANWRGERAMRRIVPTGAMFFGSNEWHKEPQWLIEALDVEKNAFRHFALSGIRSWAAPDRPVEGSPEWSQIPGGSWSADLGLLTLMVTHVADRIGPDPSPYPTPPGWCWFVVDATDDPIFKGTAEPSEAAAKAAAVRAARAALTNALKALPEEAP
jgi:hypothetical protein